MAAPTFISLTTLDFSTVFAVGGTKTSGSISVQVGDVLVVAAQSEDRLNPDITSISDTGTNTWTSGPHVTAGSTVTGGRIYTATIAAGHDGGGTITVSVVWTASVSGNVTLEKGGAGIYVYRDSSGIGSSVLSPASNSNSSISAALVTTGDNSAVVCALGDWSATSQTTRTRATVNGSTGTETEYLNVSAYTIMQQRWDDVGAAGSKTVGFATLSPGSTQLVTMAVEVLGIASAGFDVPLLDPTQIRQFNVYRM